MLYMFVTFMYNKMGHTYEIITLVPQLTVSFIQNLKDKLGAKHKYYGQVTLGVKKWFRDSSHLSSSSFFFFSSISWAFLACTFWSTSSLFCWYQRLIRKSPFSLSSLIRMMSSGKMLFSIMTDHWSLVLGKLSSIHPPFLLAKEKSRKLNTDVVG